MLFLTVKKILASQRFKYTQIYNKMVFLAPYMVSKEITRLEKVIDLLQFKHQIAERFIHAIFNTYISRQIAIMGFFVTILQINFPTERLLISINLTVLLLVLLLLSHLNYQKSMREIGPSAVKIEDLITEKYGQLDNLIR